MNASAIFRRLLPHIIILAIFLIVGMVFFSPILKGKVLPQNDVKQFLGSSKELMDFEKQNHERTLWTNSMFGGMPTYQISPYSPNSMIGTIVVYNFLVTGWSLPVPLNAFFLYCLSFYLLLLAYRVNPWVAMIGALAYAFSTFNIIILEAGHMLQAYALGVAPLVIAAAVYVLRSRKYIFGGALFALSLALLVRTNHPQISYYTGLVFLVFMIAEFVYHLKKKEIDVFLKAAGVFLVGLILAIGSTATYTLTTSEYTKETIRGKSELTQKDEVKSGGLDKDYALQWSAGKNETFTIIIPNFTGGNDITYWGAQPFVSGPVYFGAIICFLFVLGMVFLKEHERWWIFTVFVLGIMLSWGKNFMALTDLFFDYFPLYNKFRSVAFTMVMPSMVTPLLGAIILDRFIKNPVWNSDIRKKYLISAGAVAAFCLIFYVMPSLAGDFTRPSESGDPNANPDYGIFQQQGIPKDQWGDYENKVIEMRTDALQSDALRSFILIVLAGGLLYFYLDRKFRKEIVIGGIAVLVLFDMYSVNRRYVNDKTFVSKRNFDNSFIPSDADEAIMKDPDPDYRVLNLTVDPYNDATTSYFHKSIGGYHGAKLRRFQELREHYLDQETGMLRQNLGNMPPAMLLDTLTKTGQLNVLNMMNVKYIIAGPNAADVIPNRNALGHSWFVKGIKVVPNADAEIASIAHFNPADSAVTDARFNNYLAGFKPKYDPSATIKLLEYRPNYLKYQSAAPSDQFAAFSEVYYNDKLGWDVFIDGQKAEHIRVNYLIRGMKIPAGNHIIEFKFEPKSFANGEKITLVSSLLLLLFVLGGIGYEFWQNRKPVDKSATTV